MAVLSECLTESGPWIFFPMWEGGPRSRVSQSYTEARTLPVEPNQVRRLRELHETYVWKVNAAVGEGRDDLIRRLGRDFTDEALRLITDHADNEPCRRPDCPVCTRRRPVGTGSARLRSWWGRLLLGRRPAWYSNRSS